MVVDYLGLIGGDRKLSTYDRVSTHARELQALAKRHDVALLILGQVNRAEGGDGSKELSLAAARDSGVVEEAADVVIGMWRPDRQTGLDPAERIRRRDEIRRRMLKNPARRARDHDHARSRSPVPTPNGGHNMRGLTLSRRDLRLSPVFFTSTIWRASPLALKLALFLISKANHPDTDVDGKVVHRGEYRRSLRQLAQDLGVKDARSVRRAVMELVELKVVSLARDRHQTAASDAPDCSVRRATSNAPRNRKHQVIIVNGFQSLKWPCCVRRTRTRVTT